MRLPFTAIVRRALQESAASDSRLTARNRFCHPIFHASVHGGVVELRDTVRAERFARLLEMR